MTPQEQAALLRLGVAVDRERRELALALEGASIGTALVAAAEPVEEALSDWRRLRFSPSGAMLLFPGDEAYKPGAGPCPLCREPGEGSRCRCYASEVSIGGLVHPHHTRSGAVLKVILDPERGSLCTRQACPQYHVQPGLPGTGGDRGRAVCAMSGTPPSSACTPRALDIVEELHRRAAASRLPRRGKRVKVLGNLYCGRVPEGAVYIGRAAPGLPASPYANPFKLSEHGTNALPLYSKHLDAHPELVEQARRELAGRDVACWCRLDQPCHGDELLSRIYAQT